MITDLTDKSYGWVCETDRIPTERFPGISGHLLSPGKGGEGGAKDFGCITIKFTYPPLKALKYSNDLTSLAVSFL